MILSSYRIFIAEEEENLHCGIPEDQFWETPGSSWDPHLRAPLSSRRRDLHGLYPAGIKIVLMSFIIILVEIFIIYITYFHVLDNWHGGWRSQTKHEEVFK